MYLSLPRLQPPIPQGPRSVPPNPEALPPLVPTMAEWSVTPASPGLPMGGEGRTGAARDDVTSERRLTTVRPSCEAPPAGKATRPVPSALHTRVRQLPSLSFPGAPVTPGPGHVDRASDPLRLFGSWLTSLLVLFSPDSCHTRHSIGPEQIFSQRHGGIFGVGWGR